jgi:hypothetical protein
MEGVKYDYFLVTILFFDKDDHPLEAKDVGPICMPGITGLSAVAPFVPPRSLTFYPTSGEVKFELARGYTGFGQTLIGAVVFRTLLTEWPTATHHVRPGSIKAMLPKAAPAPAPSTSAQAPQKEDDDVFEAEIVPDATAAAATAPSAKTEEKNKNRRGMPYRRCNVPGCKEPCRKPQTKCLAHRDEGDFSMPEEKKKDATAAPRAGRHCTQAGCEKPQHYRGRCVEHARQYNMETHWKKYEGSTVDRKRPRTQELNEETPPASKKARVVEIGSADAPRIIINIDHSTSGSNEPLVEVQKVRAWSQGPDGLRFLCETPGPTPPQWMPWDAFVEKDHDGELVITRALLDYVRQMENARVALQKELQDAGFDLVI